MQTSPVSVLVAFSITLSKEQQTAKQLFLAIVAAQIVGYQNTGDGDNTNNARFFEAATIYTEPETGDWVVSTSFTHSDEAVNDAKKYINQAAMDSDWQKVVCKHPFYSKKSTDTPPQPTIKQLVDYLASFTTLFWTLWKPDIQYIVKNSAQSDLQNDTHFINSLLVFLKTILTPPLETIKDDKLQAAHAVFSLIENRVFSYHRIQEMSQRIQEFSVGRPQDLWDAYHSNLPALERKDSNIENFSSDGSHIRDSGSFKETSDASGITMHEPDSVQFALEEYRGTIWHLISQVATQPITAMEIAAAKQGAFSCGIDSDLLSSALLACPVQYTIRLLDSKLGTLENMGHIAQFLALLHINKTFLKPVLVDLQQDMLFKITVERFLDALLQRSACPVDIKRNQDGIKQFIHQSMSATLTQAIFEINLNKTNPVKNLARAAHQALLLMSQEQDIASQSKLILAMYDALPKSGSTAFFPGCRAMLSIMHGELQQRAAEARHALSAQEDIATQLQKFMQRRDPNDSVLRNTGFIRFFPIAQALNKLVKQYTNSSP